MGKKPSPFGFLYLIGAALSGYYLLWYGAWALFAALAGRALSNLSAPGTVQVSGIEGLATTGATMVAAGFCLTPALLALGLRRLTGKPYPTPSTAALTLILSLGLVGATALTVQRWTAPGKAPAGLEGAWHDKASARLVYRFNPDGTLDGWSDGLGGGRFGTWSRSGQTVTIRTIRDWQVAGTLTKSRIAGTMSVTSTGKPLGPVVWVRDVVP